MEYFKYFDLLKVILINSQNPFHWTVNVDSATIWTDDVYTQSQPPSPTGEIFGGSIEWLAETVQLAAFGQGFFIWVISQSTWRFWC